MDQWNPTYFARNLPAQFLTDMKISASEGARFRCVALPPGGEEAWVIVTNGGYIAHNPPAGLNKAMSDALKAGDTILWVSFPPGGGNRWLLVTEKDVFENNIPESCRLLIKDVMEGGARIKSVCFAPYDWNSWAIFTDTEPIFYGVPKACVDKVKEMTNGGDTVRSITFGESSDCWVVIGTVGTYTNNTPHGCHRVMRAMRRLGAGPVRSVAFQPGGRYVIASSAHPSGGDHQLTVDGKDFSIDTMATKIRAHLQKQVDDENIAKYAFIVRDDSAIRAWSAGPKRTAADPPAQDFTVYDWLDIGSVSKTFTAVAIRQLLRANGLDTSDKIHPYLPPSWDRDDNIDTITFRQLLTHYSGFHSSVHSYDELKAAVGHGIKDHNKDYDSTNYSLARVLGAYLIGHKEGNGDQAKATSKIFFGYVQKNVLAPLGIPWAQWRPDKTEPTLYYSDRVDDSHGVEFPDWSVDGGSGGLHLSVAELSMFLHSLTKTHTLLSEDEQTAMNQEGTGWKDPGEPGDPAFHAKSGAWDEYLDGVATWKVRTVIVGFGTGVHCVIAVNGSPKKPLMDVAVDKYKASWST